MFKGIQQTSLVDYPGVIATTLFTGGCNFRCPWCHNLSLVLPEELKKTPDIPNNRIKEMILQRKHFIDGICITGGEPSLWGDELAEFMSWIKNEGLLIKLDTNGYNLEALKKFYDAKLVDFTAMDIKSLQENYNKATGMTDIHFSTIEESIALIKKYSPQYQFRITRVPGLVLDKDIRQMEELHNVKLTVQEYRTRL